ncbi:MAG: hypothetical protein JSW63_09220 [Ignavibacterium sp.]|nr:MAG: hypothetical protein JSW63_09220 [Ignavibacterium sp.]
MMKFIFTLIVLVLFTSVFFLYSDEKDQPENKELSPLTISNAPAFVSGNVSNLDTVEMPDEIISSSSVGEVTFPHLFHYEDLEFECEECHHEINAAKLITPHDKYFSDFWIDCNICHNGNETVKMEAQACSNCHHSHPHNIADETLCAKVVIHQSCWECHEVGTGVAASESCEMCHTGERKKI